MVASQLIGGRFRIDDLEHDLLGRGGMGAVYRATDTLTGELVAVKVLDQTFEVSQTSEVFQRFAREGEALRQLNHPNIVRMIAAVEEEGRHYLVVEYIAGGSLYNLIQAQGPLPVDRAVQIALDLADALTRAHRLGILHRDLKPDNVLLAEDGTPRLADFGLAYLATGTRLTQSGMLLGTVDYLSPEACRGETPDERSDIWSFGVMLFEMLTGRVPFGGDTLMARLNAILTQPLPDPAQWAPGLPDALTGLLHCMLEKDRQQRIPSVRLVGAELEAVQKGRPVSMSGSGGAAEGRCAPLTPTSDRPRHNLPVQVTPFVGREAELAEMRRLLEDPAVRLVTVIGLGGMGKTRLALEAAAAQVDRFEEGVRFVPLGPVQTAAGLAPAIAQALHLGLRSGPDPGQQLIDFLQDREMLLLLDSFEHLLDGAGLVTALLEAAPRVKILATSRLRLDVPGEQLFQLAGMDMPTTELRADALQSSVVRLFLQGARRVRPGFELSVDDVGYVATICREVDGMPLGLLLAAAWVEMLSPPEIAAEMQSGPDLLDSAGPQGSLRAVFDYSWGQLTPAEREVFGGLSVFRGGFVREAAQAVTGATLRDLLGLVNRSLLSRTATDRYELHDLVRQAAAERLHQSGRAEEAARQHLAYYLSLGAQFEQAWSGPDQVRWLQRLAAEIDNLRAALAWSMAAGCPETGLRLALSLFWFWRNSGYHWESRDWLERLLARASHPSADRVLAFRCLAVLADDAGDDVAEMARREEALAAAEALGDLGAIVYTANRLAVRLFSLGEDDRARQLVKRNLALCRDRSDVLAEAAYSVMLMGELAHSEGDLSSTRELHERALAMLHSLNTPRATAYVLLEMGDKNLIRGDLARARELHEKSTAMFRALDDRSALGVELSNLGSVLTPLGELESSRAVLIESLSILYELRTGTAVFPLMCLGILAHAQGQPVRSVRVLGAADALRRPMGWGINSCLRREYDRALSSLRIELGEEAFTSAWRAGQAMSLPEAVALAMGDRA